MSLQIVKCEATVDTVMVFFSGTDDATTFNPGAAQEPANYSITAPKSGIPLNTQLSRGSLRDPIAYDPLFSVAVIPLLSARLK